MSTETRLEKFDIDDLDLYEREKYYSGIEIGLSKKESLQALIDSVNGNFEELSDSLGIIAEEQMNEI